MCTYGYWGRKGGAVRKLFSDSAYAGTLCWDEPKSMVTIRIILTQTELQLQLLHTVLELFRGDET